MFIPIFIAMLLGLISPAQQTLNTNDTVYLSANTTENDPDDDGDGGGGSTGGNTGQNPPPKDIAGGEDGN